MNGTSQHQNHTHTKYMTTNLGALLLMIELETLVVIVQRLTRYNFLNRRDIQYGGSRLLHRSSTSVVLCPPPRQVGWPEKVVLRV